MNNFITNFNYYINYHLSWIHKNNFVNFIIIVLCGLYPGNIRPFLNKNLEYTCKHPLVIYLLIIYMLYYENNNILLALIPSTCFIIMYYRFLKNKPTSSK